MRRFFQVSRSWLVAIVIGLVLATSFPDFFSDDAFARPRHRRSSARHNRHRNRDRQRARGRHNRNRRNRYSRHRGRYGRRHYGRHRRHHGGRYRRRHYGRYYRRHRSRYAYTPPPPRVRPAPRVQIPPERVSEIQLALKKAGYYQGEATGDYDAATRDAMSNFQKANGLKQTGMPTAQALMKLGLTRRTSPAGDTSAPGVTDPPKDKPNP